MSNNLYNSFLQGELKDFEQENQQWWQNWLWYIVLSSLKKWTKKTQCAMALKSNLQETQFLQSKDPKKKGTLKW